MPHGPKGSPAFAVIARHDSAEAISHRIFHLHLKIISFDNIRRLILELSQKVIMLTEYIEAAMKKAKYEILSDDNTFYGYIPRFDGVYANAEDLETCRNELKEVLEEWIMLGISRHLPLPIVDGIKLLVEEAV